ncbi:polyprenyl synthetase family protein [Arthrobacter alkaliphilus]|uniref:polyprenyl synthetase family protein n=1 Tax=Arthrobacter alkaliphilus TaxID=369936 RepID=UPI001F307BF2|nr:polyprenyl synthetase family protein [Arthrobacter alkaliphilus]
MTIPLARQTAPVLCSDDDRDRAGRVLEQYLESARVRAAAVGAGYGRLWEALSRCARGGKRLRPELVFISYNGLGGTDPVAVAPVAAAFEMLHTALLLHDDVIDGDFKRRGVRNLPGEYRDLAAAEGFPEDQAAHRGQSVAVIAGDLALTGAYRLIATAELPGEVRLQLLEELDAAVFASAGGELLDVEFSGAGHDPALQDVLAMTRLKTAVYSFEAPLRAGALLAGADQSVLDSLGMVGRLIGTAFQLVDDLLGTFGEEGRTGKSTFGDLAAEKSTPLMVHARQSEKWPQIAAVLAAGVHSSPQAEEVRLLLERCGARSYVEDLVRSYSAKAQEALDTSNLPPLLVAALEAFLHRAVDRRA